MSNENLSLIVFIISIILAIFTFTSKKIDFFGLFKITSKPLIWIIRIILLLIAVASITYYYRYQIIQMYLNYMKEKYKGKAASYIKNKIFEKLKSFNESLSFISYANDTIHEIAKENYVKTPFKFIKYSFKFFIFSIQYLFTSLIESILGAINFVVGGLTREKENNSNTTTFVEDV